MTKRRVMLLTFTVLFLAAQVFIVLGLVGKGYLDFSRSVAVTTIFWVVYTFLEVKYGFYMNNYVRVVVMVTIISDGFFGYYLSYYITSTVFDKILHVFGIYALALFAYILVAQLLDNPVRRVFKFILIICLGVSIGAFYEVAEFLVDKFFHPIIPSQAGLVDTDLDLICDIIGATLAALHVTVARLSDGISKDQKPPKPF